MQALSAPPKNKCGSRVCSLLSHIARVKAGIELIPFCLPLLPFICANLWSGTQGSPGLRGASCDIGGS